jgi:CelD/BcsL family acetyltransferase involved in cellulose biosynthesis
LNVSPEEWDALADRLHGSPFLRPGWVLAWHRAFGRGELELLAVRRAGELAGVLPAEHRRGVVRTPTNWHTPAFGALAVDSAAERELARSFAARGRHWSDASFLDAGGSFAGALQAESPRHLARVIQRSPVVRAQGIWSEYVKTRSKSRMSSVRRLGRRLAEHGEVAVEVLDGSDNLGAALDAGFAIEASGWKAKAGTAISLIPEVDAFYREVSAWSAERGELRLWFLTLDGRRIAFALCIEAGRSLYELKVGYEETLRRFAPGLLLTSARIQHVFESGLETYEFLGGPDAHKLQWTDDCRDMVRVLGFGAGPKGFLLAKTFEIGRPLAKSALARLRRADGSGAR